MRLQCARVRVPLDWARPRRAEDHDGGDPPPRQPIGRGGSGRCSSTGAVRSGSVELVSSEGARLDALGQGRFDVVGWALRGGAGC